jgi:hypothetical protein
MMKSCSNDLKYRITDKMPVGIALLYGDVRRSLYNSALVAEHPALSSQDFAALAAATVVTAFQKNMDDRKVMALFAAAVYDGESSPSTGTLPMDTEFIVAVEYSSTSELVGDRWITIPTLRLTAYRPTCVDGGKYPPVTAERINACRGALYLTISQGMVLVTKHKGWLGSNEIVDYLRKSFDAAVAR